MSLDAATVAQLRKRIAAERQKSDDLVIAGRCSDFSEYRYSVGYIKALDDVITIMDQIQDELQKG